MATNPLTSNAAKLERSKRFENASAEAPPVVKKFAHPEKLVKKSDPKQTFIALIKRKLKSGVTEFTDVQYAAMKSYDIDLDELRKEVRDLETKDQDKVSLVEKT
jgi:polyhydroxyalkanoate synthesis regulator phasin